MSFAKQVKGAMAQSHAYGKALKKKMDKNPEKYETRHYHREGVEGSEYSMRRAKTEKDSLAPGTKRIK
jgi:hypothetical protein